MKSHEIYRPWLPINGIPAELYCEGLYDDYEHFRILLKGREASDAVLRIRFDTIVSYRNVNESFRLKTWARLREGGSLPLPPLAIVEGSNWVAWLREEGRGVLDHVDLIHYAISTPEDCIDVASEFPPEVEWL